MPHANDKHKDLKSQEVEIQQKYTLDKGKEDLTRLY